MSRSPSRTTSASSISLGHTYSDTRQYNDWDAGEFNFYIDYFLNELDLTSHEFQFSGGGDRFSWVGGAYMWDQEGRNRNPAYSMADWVEATPNYPNDIAECSHMRIRSRRTRRARRRLRRRAASRAGRRTSRRATCRRCSGSTSTASTVGRSGLTHPERLGHGTGGGARPPAGDRLNGDEIDGWAVFGEVTIGVTENST